MRKKLLLGGLGVLLLVIVIAAVAGGGNGDGGGGTAELSAEEVEEKRKGFHCLSEWDGNHDGLEALVREHLNDPGSMETHGTRIAPVDAEGDHLIIMDFGSRNAFGGMIRSEAVGVVNNETCEATLLSIE